MNKFIIFFIIISFFSCSKKINSKNILLDKLKFSFSLPSSWKKDKDLNVWREEKTGASFNIEIEESALDLELYVKKSLKIVKKIYLYKKISKNRFKIGNLDAINTLAILQLDSFDVFLHTITIEQKNLKVNLTIAFDKNKRKSIEKDYNFIINSLEEKHENNK